MDIKYVVDAPYVRSMLEYSLYLVERMPVISILLSCGIHLYILLGEFIYLFHINRKAVITLMPGICVTLISVASPVNALLRYMMPVMAVLPMALAWCYIVNEKKERKVIEDEKTDSHN